MDLGKDFLLLGIVLLHFLHHPRIIHLACIGISCNCDPTEILKRCHNWINCFRFVIGIVLSNDPTTFDEIMKILFLIAYPTDEIILPDLAVQFILPIAVVG